MEWALRDVSTTYQHIFWNQNAWCDTRHTHTTFYTTFKAHNEQGSSREIMNRKFLNAVTVGEPLKAVHSWPIKHRHTLHYNQSPATLLLMCQLTACYKQLGALYFGDGYCPFRRCVPFISEVGIWNWRWHHIWVDNVPFEVGKVVQMCPILSLVLLASTLQWKLVSQRTKNNICIDRQCTIMLQRLFLLTHTCKKNWPSI